LLKKLKKSRGTNKLSKRQNIKKTQRSAKQGKLPRKSTKRRNKSSRQTKRKSKGKGRKTKRKSKARKTKRKSKGKARKTKGKAKGKATTVNYQKGGMGKYPFTGENSVLGAGMGNRKFNCNQPEWSPECA
jgi:hypothetical protein